MVMKKSALGGGLEKHHEYGRPTPAHFFVSLTPDQQVQDWHLSYPRRICGKIFPLLGLLQVRPTTACARLKRLADGSPQRPCEGRVLVSAALSAAHCSLIKSMDSQIPEVIETNRAQSAYFKGIFVPSRWPVRMTARVRFWCISVERRKKRGGRGV